MKVFPRSGTAFVVCDTTNPPTDNVLVRQALSMAIKRDTLANGVFKGELLPALTILPPDIPGLQPGGGAGRGRGEGEGTPGRGRLPGWGRLPRSLP